MKTFKELASSEVTHEGRFVTILEPAQSRIETYNCNEDAEVILVFDSRGWGSDEFIPDQISDYSKNVIVDSCAKVTISLTANQALQLIERLQDRADFYKRAVVEGRGGACFPAHRMHPRSPHVERARCAMR